MPKASILQTSFNAGELSPLLYGAADSPRYKKGLQKALNYLPTLQGPVIRRPGTKFMATVKNSMLPPVLIPFQFSITQAYILEFGDEYIRFYANNGQIITTGTSYQVTGTNVAGTQFYATRANLNPQANETIVNNASVAPSSILELQSPYSVFDVSLLRFAQDADTMYIVHPNYPPYKLQRNGQTFWTLKQVYFQDGPYLPLNTYKTIADFVDTTLTVLSIGPNVAEVQSGPPLTITGAITDPLGSGQIQITTSTAHGYSSNQNVWISGVAGTTEANNYDLVLPHLSGPAYWTITVNGTNSFLLLGSTFANAYSSSGTVGSALFGLSMAAQIASTKIPDLGRNISLVIAGVRYWGVIPFLGNDTNTFNNATRAYVYLPGAFPSTSAATSWQLGVWSNGLGFPGCCCFHQNRLWFAGAPNYPQEVDASTINNNSGSTAGSFETFSPSDPTTLSVADNNALQFNLTSNDANVLRWLKSSAQGLLSGSYVAEWSMTPGSTSDALTPTNFNAQQTSFFGSANIDAVQSGNATIYVQRSGRKVREMNYFFQVGTFRSTDLTELSEHITLPSVTKLALQKETQPLIWGVRSDGNLVSLIYDRNDVSLSAGWTPHQLGGQSDSSGTNPLVTSIAVIPSVDLSFDQMWLVVGRYINGATVYCVEYMTKIFDDSILQEDAFQLDCGATFDNPIPMIGISNASPAVVTTPFAHGLTNGNSIKIVGVDGLNKITTDPNGNIIKTNLVNELTFVVAGATTDTFQLNDFSGNPVDSTSFGAYVFGGFVRKLISTISGVTWLEGETVSLLCDGALAGSVTVSNSGVITLPFPAAKVQFGYPYNSDGQLMRAEAGAADGTSIGKTRRTTRVAVQMHRTGDLQLGTSFTNLIPVELSQADQNQADTAMPLFSGIKREGLESAYDFESQVCFRQNSALPGCIQSITSFMEEQDV